MAIFVIVMALTVTLTVLWNVVLVQDYIRIRELARQESERGGAFHWTFIALGSSLFVTILVLTSVFGARLFSEIRWGRIQDNFLASVSHELNSPLQSIQLHVQTLQAGGLSDSDRDRFLRVIREDVDRLGVLIGNILRTAQIAQGDLPLMTEPILLRDALDAFVGRVASRFEQEGKDRRIVLLPGPEISVATDRIVLRQILENLVSNAVKYSPADRCRIEVSMESRDEGKMVVAVSDEGIGIPRGELDMVFDRFYRIEDGDPQRSRKGTGLGLALVRSMAEAHGWRVAALSGGAGTGTTIELEIDEFEPVEAGNEMETS